MAGTNRPGEASTRIEWQVWWTLLGLFGVLALSPLWTARYPPMQDYAEHVFYAHVLQHYDGPTLDYREYYTVALGARPYSAFYWITLLFARAFDLETAGKVTVSLYVVLTVLLVGRLAAWRGSRQPGWGLLLFFPLLFHQEYYLGFTNYLLSLPLVLLVVVEQERLSEPVLDRRAMVRQFVWLVMLFFTHPFSLLVAAGMALLWGLWPPPRTWRRVLGLTLPALACTVGGWLSARSESLGHDVQWLPWGATVRYVALPLLGMQGIARASWAHLGLWLAVGVSVSGALYQGSRGVRLNRLSVACGLALAGTMTLPFRVGGYTYVNLRLAVLAYFLLAWAAGSLDFRRWTRFVLASAAGGLLLLSLVKQALISRETEAIAPLFARMPPNMRVLPLIFDNDSPELDPEIFDPHLHDQRYYHVQVGGGFSPDLFETAVNPIHYRKERRLPAPNAYLPARFSYQAHGRYYDFFLIRGAPDGFERWLGQRADTVARSGPWLLMRRR